MNDIEEIKNRIDIVDLISTYLTIKKAGVNYRALCPFHNEKTPSLMINPERQIFKCFGCNEGGDIFSFVMKMENLEFREALEMLAERAGVKLQKRSSSPQPSPLKGEGGQQAGEGNTIDRKTRLFRVNSLCAQVYHKILTSHPSGKAALDYLHRRGITDQTIKEFMIGYAPSSRAVKSFLIKKGFTETEIQNAGGPDRFYKRIIFPITDVMGNTLGFTGRTLDKNQEPKYLNTPETIIFHKSRILYNLTRARGEIKLQKTSIVVEGQMDVISSYQAGTKNVVATSGTALTPEHLKILYRYTPNIVFAFDSDSAGLATSKKAYEMALEEGFNVRLTNLGDFKDPGEVIEKNPEEWSKIIESAKPAIEWYFTLAFGKKSELSSQQKKEIAREILPIIIKIPDTIEQADYIGKLAKRLDLKEEVIFAALDKIRSTKHEIRNKLQNKNAEISNKNITKLEPEDILIGIMIKKPEYIKKISNKIIVENLSDGAKKIYKLTQKWYNGSKEKELLETLSPDLSKDEFQKLQLLLLEIEEKYSTNQEEVLSDVIIKINYNSKEKIKAQFAKEISETEKLGDRQKLKKLIKDFQEAIK